MDQHTVSRLRICFYRHRQGKNNSWCFDQPVLLDLPVVVKLHPVCQDFKIRGLHLTVSENSLFCTLYQRILNIRRGLKIHVCDPKRQHICRLAPFYCKIIFQTSGIFSVNHFIKIKISFRHIILPLFLQILFQIHQEDPGHPRFQQRGEGLPL